MKNIITCLLIVLSLSASNAQEKNIETKSVSLENLITFIVENYSSAKTTNVENRNITFLIQTAEGELSQEESILLKQSFKLLANRLKEKDHVSIVCYAGLNGIALKKTSAVDLKKILHSINDFGSSIKEFQPDGIATAYDLANKNFDAKAKNTIIMVRNPNASINANSTIQTTSLKTNKKKSNAVLITAISLLPELLAIIKN